MSKKTTFGERPRSQRELCLEIAAGLRDKKPDAIVTPTDVTKAFIEAGGFTPEQLISFQFQGARRQVEQWLKTLDGMGLPMWGQLPLLSTEGELAWEPRARMKLEGYAWNYLLRDDVVVKNTVIRDRWKEEALQRWTEPNFDAEVERLREERKEGAA
jgi:hypothetical protein